MVIVWQSERFPSTFQTWVGVGVLSDGVGAPVVTSAKTLDRPFIGVLGGLMTQLGNVSIGEVEM